MAGGWLDRFLRRDRLRLPPLSQLSDRRAMPKPSPPSRPRPPADSPDQAVPADSVPGQPDCHSQGSGLDPVALSEVKLQFLEDQAKLADTRLSELNKEFLIHRGGRQHLGRVLGLVEAHRARLSEVPGAQEAAGTPLEGQALAEHQAQLAGVVDALALLRNEANAAELSAQRSEAAWIEMSRHRSDLSLQGQAQAGKVGQLLAELAAGVPREMVGRPPTAETVRAKVEEAKEAEKTIVGKRKTIRLG